MNELGEYEKLRFHRFSTNLHSSFERSNLSETLLLTQLPFLFVYWTSIAIGKSKWIKWHRFCLEFVGICVPTILLCTVLSDWLMLCSAILVFATVLHLCFRNINNKSTAMLEEKQQWLSRSIPSITVIRAGVNLYSVICILAADLPSIFANRHLKRVDCGFGLMDVGVGMYVMAAGLTFNGAHGVTRKVVPMAALGLGRTVFVSQSFYHSSPTEYGLHCNFFCILATLVAFNAFFFTGNTASLLQKILVFCALLLANELLLERYSLRTWIASDDDGSRLSSSWMWANREGFISLLGFEALFVGGMLLRHVLRHRLPFLYLAIFAIFVAALKLSDECVSRRVVNTGYIFWIIALSSISMFCAEQLLHHQQLHLPHLIQQINQKGLVFFLAGNLATGFINFLLFPLQLAYVPSLVLINLYTFLCSATVTLIS